jgi:hypothetical protein
MMSPVLRQLPDTAAANTTTPATQSPERVTLFAELAAGSDPA